MYVSNQEGDVGDHLHLLVPTSSLFLYFPMFTEEWSIGQHHRTCRTWQKFSCDNPRWVGCLLFVYYNTLQGIKQVTAVAIYCHYQADIVQSCHGINHLWIQLLGLLSFILSCCNNHPRDVTLGCGKMSYFIDQTLYWKNKTKPSIVKTVISFSPKSFHCD